MKKLFYSFCLLLFLSGSDITQEIQAQCNPGLSQKDLDANFVSARLRAGGDLWWDLNTGRYIVPSTGSVAAIFSGSLWMGGKDPGGNLHLAGQAYGAQTGNVDYFTGPLNSSGTTDYQTCLKWDKLFEINSNDILQHQADWATDHDIDGPIPASVRGWPAKGNPYFSTVHNFDLPPGAELAPFYDRDNDGLYDPQAGDFPLTKGDQSFWWVYNDAGGAHEQTLAQPIGMEIQANAFSWQSATDFVELSTFYEYKLIYRGTQPLTDFYLSLWVDPDLGCWVDDYIGILPEEDLAFVYNADAMDENCSGLQGYLSDIPVLGIKILKSYAPGTATDEGISKFMYYFNTNAGQPSSLTDPVTGPDYYNYMKGNWKDGTPLTAGGNGYNTGNPAVDYAFEGNPADQNAWTECSAASPPGDRRFLISFGPFDLQPGDVGELAFAVVWIPSQHHPCPDVTGLVAAANEVKDFYESQGDVTSVQELPDDRFLSISPNPLTGEAVISVTSPSRLIQEAELYSPAGQLVRQFPNVSSGQMIIKRDNLAAGIYLFRARLDDGKVASGKLVIAD